ncbi:hypothetical protein IIA95_00625 [Patescibacteria group bacterium]|nr:hypothetical protein [Patescibacteria group bacterium]
MIKVTIKALFLGVAAWIMLNILIFFGTGVYSGIVTQDSTVVVSGALVSILRYVVLLLALGTFVYVFLQERKKQKVVIVTEKEPTVKFNERAPTIGPVYPSKPAEPRPSPSTQPTFRPSPSPQPTPPQKSPFQPPKSPTPPVQPTPPAGGLKPSLPSLPQGPQSSQPTPPPRSPQPSQPPQPKPLSSSPPQKPQPSGPSSTLPGFRGMPSQSQDQSRYIK